MTVGSGEAQGDGDTKSAHRRKMQDLNESDDAVLPVLNQRVNQPNAPVQLSELCVDLLGDPDTLKQRAKEAVNEWKFLQTLHHSNNKNSLPLRRHIYLSEVLVYSRI